MLPHSGSSWYGFFILYEPYATPAPKRQAPDCRKKLNSPVMGLSRVWPKSPPVPPSPRALVKPQPSCARSSVLGGDVFAAAVGGGALAAAAGC